MRGRLGGGAGEAFGVAGQAERRERGVAPEFGGAEFDARRTVDAAGAVVPGGFGVEGRELRRSGSVVGHGASVPRGGAAEPSEVDIAGVIGGVVEALCGGVRAGGRL